MLFSNGSKTRFVYPHCYRSSRQPTQRTMTALSCVIPSLKFIGTMKVIFCSDKCNCSVFTCDSLRLEVQSLVLAKLSKSQNVATRTCLHSLGISPELRHYTINGAKSSIAVRHLLLFWAKFWKFGCVQLVHQCTDDAIPITRFACNLGGFSTLLCADTVRTVFIILTLQITNCRLPKACAVDLGSSP